MKDLPFANLSIDDVNFLDTRVTPSDILRALSEAVVISDTTGIIRYATDAFGRITGYDEHELIGEHVDVLVPTSLRTGHVGHRHTFTLNPQPRAMGASRHITIQRRDHSELPVDIGLGVINVDGEPWTIATVRDISSHKNAEQKSTTLEKRFELAFEDNMSPMLLTDLDDHIIAANEAFCQMVGYSRKEVMHQDSQIFTHFEDIGITESIHRLMSTGASEKERYIKRYLHRDGQTIIAEVSKSCARDEQGNVLYYVISERDITERMRAAHLLGLRSAVNRLLTHSTSEDGFLQQVCDLLVDQGGYSLAWFGASSSTHSGGVDIVCAAGDTDYLFGEMTAWWGTPESGSGPTGAALHTGISQVVSDLAMNAPDQPWRDRALRFGFESSAAISERLGSRAVVLVTYSTDAHAFDEVTVRGLEEILLEVNFAVSYLRSVIQTESALTDANHAISALRETERARAESEQRFRLAFENNMAPMVFSDDNDRAIAVNDAFCDMVGYSRDELLGNDSTLFTLPEDFGITEQNHLRLVSEELDQIRYVKHYRRKDGRVVVSEVSRSAARDADGRTLYFVSSERDITEERALTAQLSYQAMHDPLTGLANRTLFEDRLEHAHASFARHGGIGAVLLLDLDDFKGVNDTYGHVVGDELLTGVARRLELATRSSDTLCRLGGDEFLYLAEGLESPAEAEQVANRLLDVLSEHFVFNGIELEQRASVGIVICDGGNASHMDYVREADVALYEAKRFRRGRHVLFNSSMHETAVHRFALIQELRHAVQAGQLSMHYQPIVDLMTTEVIGFESLMRWLHPERGWISPADFIPLAEQSELILDLGAFAIREAIAAAATWHGARSRSEEPFVTVNLSAHQFHHGDLVPMIEESLAASNLPPSRLIVEITEGVALADAAETMDTLAQLKALGIGLALDDFGTGFSSLSYLAMLSPEIIKVDRSFVSPDQSSTQASTLLEAIISLGRELNTTVLAEGIETNAQFHHLRELGCQLGQGFLFSPAVHGNDVYAILQQSSGNWGDKIHVNHRLNLQSP